MSTECVGCGAPLNLRLHECEYCRRDIAPAVRVPHPQDLDAQRYAAAQRYQLGWTDPRNIYGYGLQSQMNAANNACQNQFNTQGNYQRDYNSDSWGGRPREWWEFMNGR